MTLRERIDASLNPVWVKELRQSLRSRLFRVAFLATLICAATFSDLALGTASDSLGLHLFQISYGVLTATVVGLVPFYIFYASPGEGQARAPASLSGVVGFVRESGSMSRDVVPVVHSRFPPPA